MDCYKSCYTIISWYTHSSRNIWFHCTFLKEVWKSSFKDISQYWNCKGIVKGYSNATVHPSFRNILVNTLESTSFNGFWEFCLNFRQVLMTKKSSYPSKHICLLSDMFSDSDLSFLCRQTMMFYDIYLCSSVAVTTSK
jgi:hypothetical protein